MVVQKSFAQIKLPNDPGGVLEAGTKQYIDAGDATKQPLDTDLTAIAGLTATTDNFIVSVSSTWASRTPAQVKTTLAIAESDVANLTTDLAAKAPLASPTFTGLVTCVRLVKTPQTVTYAGTVTIDASTGDAFAITATADLHLAAPTNPTNGQMLVIE